jgi:uncharacterized repeat protein (TIGR01451 family)
MQPNCTPLSDFRFTFGSGFGPRVTGPWGALSIVSGPFPRVITTEPSAPDRGDQGQTTSATIQGATTVELNAAERALLGNGELRIQGGTTDNPVTDANRFAFGALRCSDDNVNGDNIEFVRFPSSLKRVYCFAYYVVPPPKSGTIIVTKHVSSPPNADKTFTFQGNISYTTDERFQLSVVRGADASMTFYRAATGPNDPPWTAAEVVPAGWSLTGLACSSSLGSVITRNPPEKVSITLLAGDTVRCTFTDAQSPLASQLLISKVSSGGVGTFPFTVKDITGKVVLETQATTKAPDAAVVADSTPKTLDPGTYMVGERLPDASGGHWVQTAVNCNARRVRTRRRRAAPPPTTVTITADKGQVCVFENRFVPEGSITISKTTLGDSGSTHFTVTPFDDLATQYSKTATTTEAGETVVARGDSTARLTLGRYLIQEHGTISDREGEWTLQSVTCDGQLRPFERGQVVVELTSADPDRACNFVNGFTATPPPLPEPAPIDPGTAGAPQPDIVVTKRALRSNVRLGGTVTFAITVRNNGPVAAHHVFVADAPGKRGQLVSARASRAECDELVPLHCDVGTLAPGAEVTVLVRMRATGSPLMRNLAVAGSGTDDARLANNVAVARVRVRRTSLVGACPAAARPKAHAAC